VMLLVSVLAVAVGGVAALAGAGWIADVVWAGATAAVAVRLVVDIVADLVRRRAGVDVIALLAMVGALALGQFLAGAVIAVMLTGGQALEAYAAGRARRELTALLDSAPRVAHRLCDDHVETVPVDAIERGELLVVRSGEAVPVDAVVVDSVALFDESALTGETRPVSRREHGRVGSGAVNAGGARPGACGDDRGGQHLRGHRPAGARGRRRTDAVHPDGRPVRAGVRAGDAGRGSGSLDRVG